MFQRLLGVVAVWFYWGTPIVPCVFCCLLFSVVSGAAELPCWRIGAVGLSSSCDLSVNKEKDVLLLSTRWTDHFGRRCDATRKPTPRTPSFDTMMMISGTRLAASTISRPSWRLFSGLDVSGSARNLHAGWSVGDSTPTTTTTTMVPTPHHHPQPHSLGSIMLWQPLFPCQPPFLPARDNFLTMIKQESFFSSSTLSVGIPFLLQRWRPLSSFFSSTTSAGVSFFPTPSDLLHSLAVWLIKRTYQPSLLRKKRKSGYLKRRQTVGGRKIFKRRRAKGRARLFGA